jgi:hypothetical protein
VELHANTRTIEIGKDKIRTVEYAAPLFICLKYLSSISPPHCVAHECGRSANGSTGGVGMEWAPMTPGRTAATPMYGDARTPLRTSSSLYLPLSRATGAV